MWRKFTRQANHHAANMAIRRYVAPSTQLSMAVSPLPGSAGWAQSQRAFAMKGWYRPPFIFSIASEDPYRFV